ncbi:c2H2 type zinc-finger (2 copies) domain-containing protein [Sarocladium implicatum]|nr:c2H2 type zinc-finger (2 copies) domain-containing protein [Sarocladium implicatum]
MVAASYLCSLCGVTFADGVAQRQHAKSEWHVYRLRCRVASPGEVPSPPVTPEHSETGTPAHVTIDVDKASYSSSIDENEDSSEEPGSEELDSEEDNYECDPGQCLFCTSILDTFDSNLEHMRRSHSFQVPYKSHLNVDLETFVWFLHMVVHTYHECLSCGTRRGSAESAMQHMVAKGHCRVDVAGEIADFYNADHLQSQAQIDERQIDGSSLRLPSGKVAGSRSKHPSSSQTAPLDEPRSHLSRTRRARNEMLEAATEEAKNRTTDAPESSSSSSNALQKHARRADAITKALGQLSAGDQMTLAHLPSSEQRALLATRKKQLSKAQRDERRAWSRVERLGNRTLMKHFKPDTPGRSNG